MRKTICLPILCGAVLVNTAAFAEDWSRFEGQDNPGSGYSSMSANDQQRSYTGTQAFESGSVGAYGNGAIGPYGNGAIGRIPLKNSAVQRLRLGRRHFFKV
jgi:hypothetical protein